MKKYNIFALLMLLIAPLCFMACSENEDTVEEFPDWKNRNEAYFDNIYEKAMGIEDAAGRLSETTRLRTPYRPDMPITSW